MIKHAARSNGTPSACWSFDDAREIIRKGMVTRATPSGVFAAPVAALPKFRSVVEPGGCRCRIDSSRRRQRRATSGQTWFRPAPPAIHPIGEPPAPRRSGPLVSSATDDSDTGWGRRTDNSAFSGWRQTAPAGAALDGSHLIEGAPRWRRAVIHHSHLDQPCSGAHAPAGLVAPRIRRAAGTVFVEGFHLICANAGLQPARQGLRHAAPGSCGVDDPGRSPIRRWYLPITNSNPDSRSVRLVTPEASGGHPPWSRTCCIRRPTADSTVVLGWRAAAGPLWMRPGDGVTYGWVSRSVIQVRSPLPRWWFGRCAGSQRV